jgi:hypothetical protein
VGFGPLKLGRLKTGGWRVLGEAEVAALRRAVSAEERKSASPPALRATSPASGEGDT